MVWIHYYRFKVTKKNKYVPGCSVWCSWTTANVHAPLWIQLTALPLQSFSHLMECTILTPLLSKSTMKSHTHWWRWVIRERGMPEHNWLKLNINWSSQNLFKNLCSSLFSLLTKSVLECTSYLCSVWPFFPVDISITEPQKNLSFFINTEKISSQLSLMIT